MYRPPITKTKDGINDTFVIPYSAYQMLVGQLSLDGFIKGSVKFSLDGSVVNGKTDMNSMLYQSRNITTAMRNIAAYMTNAMRANGSIVLRHSLNDSSLIISTQAMTGEALLQIQLFTMRWG